MTIFKAFIKTFLKVLPSLLVYLGMLALFGNMTASANMKQSTERFSEVTLSVSITDKDNSELSRAVKNFISRTEKIVELNTDDPQTINDNVRFAMIDFGVYIPEGFEKTGEINYFSNGDSVSSALMTRKLDTYLRNIDIYRNNGYNLTDAISCADRIAEKTADVSVGLVSGEKKSESNYLLYMFRFSGYVLLMVICISTGLVLTQLHKKELVDRVACSSYSFLKRKGELILGLFVMALTLTCGILIINVMSGAGKADFWKFPGYTLDLISLMIFGMAFGYLLSTITSNELVINLISNTVILMSCFISGVFTERQLLSPSVVEAAKFQPLYWYIDAAEELNTVTASPLITVHAMQSMMIPLLFAVIVLFAGLIISKARHR